MFTRLLKKGTFTLLKNIGGEGGGPRPPPVLMALLLTKRDFVARKTYSNFSCENSNNLWHAQIKQRFSHIPGNIALGEINFRSIRLKTSNFFNWKLSLRHWKSSKVVGTFRNFLEWGGETFSDRSKTQTTCNMAVIDTTVSFHGKGMTVQCCPTVQYCPPLDDMCSSIRSKLG